jgi:hypothetical protein
VAEPPFLGIVDLHHLVSPVPVRPICAVLVTAEDFPFRDRIGDYRDREPAWVSMFRA